MNNPSNYTLVGCLKSICIKEGLSLKESERIVILHTLNSMSNNKTHTAKMLGIGIRTLQRKLARYKQEDNTNATT